MIDRDESTRTELDPELARLVEDTRHADAFETRFDHRAGARVLERVRRAVGSARGAGTKSVLVRSVVVLAERLRADDGARLVVELGCATRMR